MMRDLMKARLRLSNTSNLITKLLKIEYKDKEMPNMTNVFYHWFENDFYFADKAENLVTELRDTMNKSLALAVKKLSNPVN